MRNLLYSLALMFTFSASMQAQSFGISGNYDATYEAFGVGFLTGGDAVYGAGDFNFGESHWSWSVDLNFEAKYWNNQAFFIGAGYTGYQINDRYDNQPAAYYANFSYWNKPLVVSYGVGYLNSSIDSPSGWGVYHKFRLTILLVSFY